MNASVRAGRKALKDSGAPVTIHLIPPAGLFPYLILLILPFCKFLSPRQSTHSSGHSGSRGGSADLWFVPPLAQTGRASGHFESQPPALARQVQRSRKRGRVHWLHRGPGHHLWVCFFRRPTTANTVNMHAQKQRKSCNISSVFVSTQYHSGNSSCPMWLRDLPASLVSPKQTKYHKRQAGLVCCFVCHTYCY